jgi:hypothetical protein
MMVGICRDRLIHHPRHFRATGFQKRYTTSAAKPPDQDNRRSHGVFGIFPKRGD